MNGRTSACGKKEHMSANSSVGNSNRLVDGMVLNRCVEEVTDAQGDRKTARQIADVAEVKTRDRLGANQTQNNLRK